MKAVLFAATLFLMTLSPIAVASEPIATRDHIASPTLSGGAATAACTIVYYNACSGWAWLFGGFNRGDQIGVVYDLAEDCGMQNGDTWTMDGGFWYWRYTTPSRNFFGVYYDLYNVDGQGCLTGASIGTSAPYDPVERWNFIPSLGSVSSPDVAVTATWTLGTLPYAATDDNIANAAGGPACAGVGVGTGSSVRYGNTDQGTVYCPPVPFSDALGPTNLLVVTFWSQEVPTATEASSWSDIKSLFR